MGERDRPGRSRRRAPGAELPRLDGRGLSPPAATGTSDDALAVRLRRHMTPARRRAGRAVLSSSRRAKIAEILSVGGRPVEQVRAGGARARHLLRRRVAGEVAGAGQGPPRARGAGRARRRGRLLLLAPRRLAHRHRCAPCSSTCGAARWRRGSTLTQQLVKNVFLTSERSVFRKIREAFIAVAVEVQHSKQSILQGYLNGIYLGGANGIQYYGLGTAARAYFGKDATELTLPEAAALAGMIKSPGLLLARRPPRSLPPAARRGAPPHGRAKAGSTPAELERALADPGRDLADAPRRPRRPALRRRHGERGPRALRPPAGWATAATTSSRRSRCGTRRSPARR